MIIGILFRIVFFKELTSSIDELEKAFSGRIDMVTDKANNICFLEQIKKDKIVGIVFKGTQSHH